MAKKQAENEKKLIDAAAAKKMRIDAETKRDEAAEIVKKLAEATEAKKEAKLKA